MAADAHDILGRPALGPVAERLELDRQRCGALLDLLDVGVDAVRERGGDLLRVVAVGGVLAGEVAAVEEQPRRAVLLDVGAAERRRQPAEPAAAPEVDLPQPVARGVEALQAERVRLARGVDVRDAPAVHDDLAGRRQPCHGVARLPGRLGGRARRDRVRRRQCRAGRLHEPPPRQPLSHGTPPSRNRYGFDRPVGQVYPDQHATGNAVSLRGPSIPGPADRPPGGADDPGAARGRPRGRAAGGPAPLRQDEPAARARGAAARDRVAHRARRLLARHRHDRRGAPDRGRLRAARQRLDPRPPGRAARPARAERRDRRRERRGRAAAHVAGSRGGGDRRRTGCSTCRRRCGSATRRRRW